MDFEGLLHFLARQKRLAREVHTCYQAGAFGYGKKQLPVMSCQLATFGAQLGVGLYMFLVGMELKTELFHSRAMSAAGISIAGMVVPFVLGGLLAPWLVTVPGLFW